MLESNGVRETVKEWQPGCASPALILPRKLKNSEGFSGSPEDASRGQSAPHQPVLDYSRVWMTRIACGKNCSCWVCGNSVTVSAGINGMNEIVRSGPYSARGCILPRDPMGPGRACVTGDMDISIGSCGHRARPCISTWVLVLVDRHPIGSIRRSFPHDPVYFRCAGDHRCRSSNDIQIAGGISGNATRVGRGIAIIEPEIVCHRPGHPPHYYSSTRAKSCHRGLLLRKYRRYCQDKPPRWEPHLPADTPCS